jgi:hypothetical protein
MGSARPLQARCGLFASFLASFGAFHAALPFIFVIEKWVVFVLTGSALEPF